MSKHVNATKPVGPYEDFGACVAANQDKDDPEAYCAAIEANKDVKNWPLKVGVPVEEKSKQLEALRAILAKDPKGQRRYFAATVKAIDEDDMEADIVASTAQMDRDHEVVKPDGMVLPKPRRVPLVSSHQYSDLRKHIGDVPRVKVNGEISARPRWFAGMGNPEADWGWTLAKMGVSAFSIGFLPVEWVDADLTDDKVVERVLAGKEPLRTYTKWELAEISQVIVPSNRQAVQRMIEAGILAKDWEKVEGLSEDPMAADAQKAFDAALKAWQVKQAEQVTQVISEHVAQTGVWLTVDQVAVMCPSCAEKMRAGGIIKVNLSELVRQKPKDFTCPKPFATFTACVDRFGDEPGIDDPEAFCAAWEAFCGEEESADADGKSRHGDCPEGHVFNEETGKCEKKAAEPEPAKEPAKAAPEPVHAPAVDIMKLFEAASKKQSEQYLPSVPVIGRAVVKINFETDVLPKLQAALEVFGKSIKKDVEVMVNDAVSASVEKAFGPDSAAHTKTTDLIKAVTTGVLEAVDQRIALAQGDVDAWLKR